MNRHMTLIEMHAACCAGENALVTGHYVIYTCQIPSIETAQRHPHCYDIRIVDGVEVHYEELNKGGDWFYGLNDRLLPYGPFQSQDEAVRDATECLMDFRNRMGGKVLSVKSAHGPELLMTRRRPVWTL